MNGAIPGCAPLVLGLLHHVLQRPEREVRRCEGEVSHQGSTVGSRQDDSDQPPAAHHQPTAAPPPVIGGRCQHSTHIAHTAHSTHSTHRLWFSCGQQGACLNLLCASREIHQEFQFTVVDLLYVLLTHILSRAVEV